MLQHTRAVLQIISPIHNGLLLRCSIDGLFLVIMDISKELVDHFSVELWSILVAKEGSKFFWMFLNRLQ